MVLNDHIPHQLWHRTALSRSVSLVLETVVHTVLSCWVCRVSLQYSWTTEAEAEAANLVFHCYPMMIFEILFSSLSPQKTKEAGHVQYPPHIFSACSISQSLQTSLFPHFAVLFFVLILHVSLQHSAVIYYLHTFTYLYIKVQLWYKSLAVVMWLSCCKKCSCIVFGYAICNARGFQSSYSVLFIVLFWTPSCIISKQANTDFVFLNVLLIMKNQDSAYVTGDSAV